jgi:hypothetical protein
MGCKDGWDGQVGRPDRRTRADYEGRRRVGAALFPARADNGRARASRREARTWRSSARHQGSRRARVVCGGGATALITVADDVRGDGDPGRVHAPGVTDIRKRGVVDASILAPSCL